LYRGTTLSPGNAQPVAGDADDTGRHGLLAAPFFRCRVPLACSGSQTPRRPRAQPGYNVRLTRARSLAFPAQNEVLLARLRQTTQRKTRRRGPFLAPLPEKRRGICLRTPASGHLFGAVPLHFYAYVQWPRSRCPRGHRHSSGRAMRMELFRPPSHVFRRSIMPRDSCHSLGL